MANKIDISCIIVSYNCLSSLKTCIESLSSQRGVSFETIIIDNASIDKSADYILSLGNKNQILTQNIGFGAAVNMAAKHAEGRYLFILNPDTELAPNTLKDIYEFAIKRPDAGIIAPVLLFPDGRLQLSARKIPRRRDFLVGRGSPLFRFGLTKERDAGYIIPSDDKPFEVPAVSATAIFMNVDIFNRLNGFDERFFMYLEDLDICERVSQMGLKIFIMPGVKIIHQWRKSSQTRPLRSSYHHHLSAYKYFQKHFPSQWYFNLPLGVVLCMGFCVSGVGQLFRRR